MLISTLGYTSRDHKWRRELQEDILEKVTSSLNCGTCSAWDWVLCVSIFMLIQEY